MSKQKKRKKNKLLPKDRILRQNSANIVESLKDNEYLKDKDIIWLENPPEKMSEVILKFAGPLINLDWSLERQERVIAFSIMVWNICLMPKDDKDKHISTLLDSFGDDPEVRKDVLNTIDFLTKRKELFFSSNHKFILNYSFNRRGNTLSLNVAYPIVL